MRLTVWWSLHFVASCFHFKAINVSSTKFYGHSPVSCMLSISFAISLRPSYPNTLSTFPDTLSSP
jgi:hypothetical protein